MRRILLSLALALATTQAQAQSSIQSQSSVAIEGNHIFCQAPCSLATAVVTSGTSAGFFLIFDASADPANGTGQQPRYCFPMSANSGNNFVWQLPSRFLNGVVFVFSTGANCTTKTESATAFFTAQVTP
jgi:hypothetical protein